MSTDPTHQKPRVLFVDDEPAVLLALARLMRGLRNDMESVFVGGAAEALAQLGLRSFDVVVADIRMPDMDGAQVLSEMQRSFPGIIRIVLSGHAEMGAARRSLSLAHHFLAKPCDAATLRAVLVRALGLRKLLQNRELQAVIACMRDLPARPYIYSTLCCLLAEPEIDWRDVARLISRDTALCHAFLNIVGSTFSPPTQHNMSLETAVAYLGPTRLGSRVVAATATSALAGRAERHGHDPARYETHALLCAHIASALVHDTHMSEDAFAAGLLHNVGELLLLAEGSEDHLRVRAYSAAHGVSLHDAERKLGSVSHGHVGAYLLNEWGLSHSILEAVARHDQPLATPHAVLDVVDAVHVSALLADHYVHHAPNALELASNYLAPFSTARSLLEISASAEVWLAQRERTRVEVAHGHDHGPWPASPETRA
jgi:HD-like signal output (HDOD) protein/CheY-like chemotaxis protein